MEKYLDTRLRIRELVRSAIVSKILFLYFNINVRFLKYFIFQVFDKVHFVKMNYKLKNIFKATI